jgi:hypothetical protein
MAIEVAVEWGLGMYIDTTNNAMMDGAESQAKRTEVIVLRHNGRWREGPAGCRCTARTSRTWSIGCSQQGGGAHGEA